MSRADKPDEKSVDHEKGAGYALTPTEAYRLAPMQQELQASMDRYDRALRQMHGLAIGVLVRSQRKDADPTDWRFDIRDDGVYLVHGGE